MARGLSISLVVLGHTSLPAWLNGPLSTVRLPLLFFVSGYLFNWERYRGQPGRLLRHRGRRLLVPYLAAGLLTFLFWLLARRPTSPDAQAIPWWRPLAGWLYGSASAEWLVFNLPLWYLPASFGGQVVFWGLLRLVASRSPASQAAAALALGLAGVALGQHVHLPWALDVALAAQPFFWAGWFLRQARWMPGEGTAFPPAPAWARRPAAVALAAGLWLAALGINGSVAINTREYGQPLWFYAGGLGGSLLALHLAAGLARWSPARAVLAYLGRHSMVVLNFHVGLAFPVLSWVLQAVAGDPLAGAWPLYWVWGLGSTAALAAWLGRRPRLAAWFEGTFQGTAPAPPAPPSPRPAAVRGTLPTGAARGIPSAPRGSAAAPGTPSGPRGSGAAPGTPSGPRGAARAPGTPSGPRGPASALGRVASPSR